jgi:hypothetical protein
VQRRLSYRLTSGAIELVANESAPALFRQDPGPEHPRWLVPHVPAMSAFQVRNPIGVFILMKTDDGSLHLGRGLRARGRRLGDG